jgi:hypothetical protein
VGGLETLLAAGKCIFFGTDLHIKQPELLLREDIDACALMFVACQSRITSPEHPSAGSE